MPNNLQSQPEEELAVSLDIENNIAVISMNRPAMRNCFSADFLHDMKHALAEIRAHKEITAVILRGSEGVFCAGGDVKEMVARFKAGGFSPDDYRKRLYSMNDWISQLRNLEVPLIAAVDGVAYGAGFALALCADFILASPNARFCSVFARIGLIPDCGLLFALPRIVGIQRAKEIIFTGRPIAAEEAHTLGIVLEIHEVDTLDAAAQSLAQRLSEASPVAFAIGKKILNQALDADAASIVDLEANGQAICLSSDYHNDAVSRFVDKKPMRFNWEA